MATKALEDQDKELAIQILRNMIPFLNKFKDIEHPQNPDLWEENDNEL